MVMLPVKLHTNHEISILVFRTSQYLALHITLHTLTVTIYCRNTIILVILWYPTLTLSPCLTISPSPSLGSTPSHSPSPSPSLGPTPSHNPSLSRTPSLTPNSTHSPCGYVYWASLCGRRTE